MGEKRVLRYAVELEEKHARILRAVYGSIQRGVEAAIKELIERHPELAKVMEIIASMQKWKVYITSQGA